MCAFLAHRTAQRSKMIMRPLCPRDCAWSVALDNSPMLLITNRCPYGTTCEARQGARIGVTAEVLALMQCIAISIDSQRYCATNARLEIATQHHVMGETSTVSA